MRAVPGGVALVLGVMANYVLALVVPMDPNAVTCMMVYTITCIGLMVLFKQCEPFNILSSSNFLTSELIDATRLTASVYDTVCLIPNRLWSALCRAASNRPRGSKMR